MRTIRFVFLLSLVSGLFAQTAIADTLLVESVQSAPAVSGPQRGMTMEQIIQNWGEPQQRLGPVGEPPISHWIYPDFVVYFESNYALHSVVPHNN
ncbi:hypothetical protein MNBD_GAMMA15-984 [hydrothermal vent metagenome]|uniref:Lipoprotein SmpA/OmlA domain-containing protein n=1 Tax=hydrothermal vent metagenome TaxID=652676 RepID=A0A3B0Y846_9ZZZZ